MKLAKLAVNVAALITWAWLALHFWNRGEILGAVAIAVMFALGAGIVVAALLHTPHNSS